MQNQQAEVNLKSDHFHHLILGKYGNSQIYYCQTATHLIVPGSTEHRIFLKFLALYVTQLYLHKHIYRWIVFNSE